MARLSRSSRSTSIDLYEGYRHAIRAQTAGRGDHVHLSDEAYPARSTRSGASASARRGRGVGRRARPPRGRRRQVAGRTSSVPATPPATARERADRARPASAMRAARREPLIAEAWAEEDVPLDLPLPTGAGPTAARRAAPRLYRPRRRRAAMACRAARSHRRATTNGYAEGVISKMKVIKRSRLQTAHLRRAPSAGLPRMRVNLTSPRPPPDRQQPSP
jgi:hypothetical protein